MNQIEYIYANEHLISSSLICPICLDVLKDPHTHVTCDSAFCRSCLLQLSEPICPICRWHWDDILPIEYNKYLPKSTRLIRNMLDELMVECLQCHTIRRRGQFEHQCQPMNSKTSILIKTKKSENLTMILSVFVLILSVLFIYSFRNFIFERAVNRQTELITGSGIDIDQYLFEKIYYLIVKIIEYSLGVFLFNLSLWFSILFYGDRVTSKSTSQILRKFLEISIIINLITYSIYY
jgi:hypothetical protein